MPAFILYLPIHFSNYNQNQNLFCFHFHDFIFGNGTEIGISMIYQLPFPKMMPSTLLLHILLIITVAFCSIPAVRSHSNPIRLPTQDNNKNSNDDDLGYDACGEWSKKPAASSCPVKCFRPDPVCGVDGVTYWCGCDDAQCARTKVARKGFCEVGNNHGAAAQALLLVHIVWLIVLGFSILFGFF